MKFSGTLVIALSVAGVLWAAEDANPLKTDKDRASYSIGLELGRSFKTRGLDINTETLTLGFKHAFAGDKPLLNDQQAQEALTAYEKDMMAKRDAALKAAGDKNKQEGAAFLKANNQKEGVKTLPSGLQYKIIKAGDGKIPKADDQVRTHYRGTLVDGKEFDSSYKRNEPATFPVKNVIRGWQEALQLMPVGSKWQLFVPSDLAYGENGAGPMIGPNATLVFEIELLGIEDKPAEPAK